MAYCLDTNTIVLCLRGKSAKAANRLRTTPASEVRVPMQVLAELQVGAAKSAKPVENMAAVESFVQPFSLIWPDEAVVEHYVAIRTALESMGQRHQRGGSLDRRHGASQGRCDRHQQRA